MAESEQQDDILAKRLTQGQEAQRLLQNPLIEGFFADHYRACYDAFLALPIGSTLEAYQTVHHDLLSIQRLRSTLQAYITRAERDTLEAKQQEDVPEDIGV